MPNGNQRSTLIPNNHHNNQHNLINPGPCFAHGIGSALVPEIPCTSYALDIKDREEDREDKNSLGPKMAVYARLVFTALGRVKERFDR